MIVNSEFVCGLQWICDVGMCFVHGTEMMIHWYSEMFDKVWLLHDCNYFVQ